MEVHGRGRSGRSRATPGKAPSEQGRVGRGALQPALTEALTELAILPSLLGRVRGRVPAHLQEKLRVSRQLHGPCPSGESQHTATNVPKVGLLRLPAGWLAHAGPVPHPEVAAPHSKDEKEPPWPEGSWHRQHRLC